MLFKQQVKPSGRVPPSNTAPSKGDIHVFKELTYLTGTRLKRPPVHVLGRSSGIRADSHRLHLTMTKKNPFIFSIFPWPSIRTLS